MTASIHATLGNVPEDVTREAEQREGLERMIVPGVRQFLGFVSGDWTVERRTSKSLVFLSYEPLAAAEAMGARN